MKRHYNGHCSITCLPQPTSTVSYVSSATQRTLARCIKELVPTKALEDAYILSNLLGSCKTTAFLTSSFVAYDAVRRPRTQKVVEISRARGRLLSLEDVEAWEHERLDVGKIEEAMVGRAGMGWIWDVDLKRELENAKADFVEKGTGEVQCDTGMDGRYMKQIKQSFLLVK
jgi:hypothetical protein